MIEIKNEKIAPLPENMAQRYKSLYRLQAELTKSSECSSVSVDVQFFENDDRIIRSIQVRGLDQDGNAIQYYKSYYRNGQLSEGGLIKNGRYEESVQFHEDGTPSGKPLLKAMKDKVSGRV